MAIVEWYLPDVSLEIAVDNVAYYFVDIYTDPGEIESDCGLCAVANADGVYALDDSQIPGNVIRGEIRVSNTHIEGELVRYYSISQGGDFSTKEFPCTDTFTFAMDYGGPLPPSL